MGVSLSRYVNTVVGNVCVSLFSCVEMKAATSGHVFSIFDENVKTSDDSVPYAKSIRFIQFIPVFTLWFMLHRSTDYLV